MWGFSQERDALWRSVIEVKYVRVMGGWSSLPVMGLMVWVFGSLFEWGGIL
jgi:hypothetical protein